MTTSEKKSTKQFSSQLLFHETCIEFRQNFRRQTIRLALNPWLIIKVLFRNLISYDQLVIFESLNPLNEMVELLNKFGKVELIALREVSRINLRMHKDRLTGNPLIKFAIAISVALGLLKGIEALAENIEVIKWLLSSVVFQSIMEQLFFFFIVQFPILGMIYYFFLWPSLFRAQLIDDAIIIAIQDKAILNAETNIENDT